MRKGHETVRDREYSKYQAGKKIKKIEYGVKYPDGTVDWFARFDLSTAAGREDFRAQRAREMEHLHAPDAGVTFLTRVAVTRFSAPEVVG